MSDTDQSDRVYLDPEAAIALLPDKEEIHTFRNPAGILLGADWGRKKIIEAILSAGKAEVTGEMAQHLGHGLVIDNNGLLFIEAAKYQEPATD